jgi:hypothetical protein
MAVNRSNLSPPSNAVVPKIVSLIRGTLTRAIISAPPTNKLVILALEKVTFLNILKSISGSETLDSRNTKRAKRNIEAARRLTVSASDPCHRAKLRTARAAASNTPPI